MPEIITAVQVVVREYLGVIWLALPIDSACMGRSRYSLVKLKPCHLILGGHHFDMMWMLSSVEAIIGTVPAASSVAQQSIQCGHEVFSCLENDVWTKVQSLKVYFRKPWDPFAHNLLPNQVDLYYCIHRWMNEWMNDWQFEGFSTYSDFLKLIRSCKFMKYCLGVI